MLKLLDRYILKQYFSKLFSSIFAFVVIFLLVDVIDHLDKFIDSNMPQEKIIQYYFYTMPWFISIGLPMSLLLATIFCMGLLQKRNEIAAIKASGISIRRVSVSMIILGILFSIFSFYLDNIVVAPYLNKRSILREQYFKKSRSSWTVKKQDIFRQVGKDEVLAIKRYNFKNNTANNISVQKFLDGKMTSRLDAASMIWDDAINEWKINNYRLRSWDDSQNLVYNYIKSDTVLNLNFSPVDLTTQSVKPEEMNYWELKNFVNKLKLNGIKDPRWEVNVHFKTAFACSSFIMILFGLSLSVGKQRSNMAVGLGISIMVIFLYYGFIKFGQSFGYQGNVSPFLSVWFGNIVFFIIGTFLFYKTRT